MAQFKQNKMINGGLNSDFDYDLVPAGDYVDAVNIATYGGVNNILGNAQVQLKDLDGTTNFTLDTSYTLVASVANTLRDSIIYLIANTSGNHLLTEYNQTTDTAKIIVKCGTNAQSGALNLSSSAQSHNVRIINRADTDEEGDLMLWLDKDGVPRKINLRKAKNGGYGASILAEYTTVIKKPPMYAPLNINLVNIASGSLNIQSKVYQFAYRYIYDDYEKSVFSPISNGLVPYFIFNETNAIPEDSSSGYNAITMTIKSGSGNVKNIELIYREFFDGIWSNFYAIDTFASTGSDITYTFTGTGQKIPLDNSDAPDVLQSDYVPISAKAQEVVNGNVIVYANFKEGYDKSAITATIGSTAGTYINSNNMYVSGSLNPATNMSLSPGGKYKIGVIYFDEFGRNAGVFTNSSMVINVPHIHWDLSLGNNVRKTYLPSISISTAAPSWAKTFRLAITEDNNYESEVITDVIDYKYASVGATGTTCSSSNVIMAPVANGGIDNTIPFFKAYTGSNKFKLTYKDCNSNTAVTSYYPESSTAVNISYRNKLITDPDRLIFEYNKLIDGSSSDYSLVVNSTGSSGGSVPSTDFEFISVVAQGTPQTWTWAFRYVGTSSIPSSVFSWASNSPYGRDPYSGWVTNTISALVPDQIFHITRYLASSATPNGAFINGATLTTASPNITLTNLTSDTLYVYISGTKHTLNAHTTSGDSFTGDVPYGYTVNTYKYQTVTGSVSDSYVTVSVLDATIIPGSSLNIPKQLIARISNLGYTFQTGDYISFVYDYYKDKQLGDQYAGQGVNESVFKVIDLLLNPDFINTDGTTSTLDGLWLQLESTAKSFLDASGDTSTSTHIIGLKSKILRQKKTSSIGTGGDVFYEIPQTYDVASYTLNTVIQMTTAGDSVYKADYVVLDGSTATPIGGKTDTVQRVFFSAVPTKNYLISEDKGSPLFLAKINKNGRPAIDDKQARQREFPASARWSQNLEFNSNVNGLNRFLYLDFKDMDASFGAIKRLSVRDRMLRVYQEDKVGMLPVYQSIITNAAGGTDLTLSTELFNNVQYYAGNYSIGNAIGSLISDSYADYFIDDIRKAICRLGQEGITPISITNNINDWASNNIKKNATYTSGYDSAHRTAIFSSVSGSDTYTIAFSERIDRFESRYTYYPKSIISLNNRLYTSNDRGGFWEHKSTVSYCNFYGTQSDAKITLLFNDNPVMNKIYMTLSEIGNSVWYASLVRGSANTTDSSIPSSYFRNQEGSFNAPFLRASSISTPTTGKPIRGNYCLTELTALAPSNYVTLLVLKYGYNESKIN